MFEDREILVLFVAAAALAAALAAWKHLGPHRQWAVGALVALCTALVCTVVESGLEGTAAAVCNVVEHVAYVSHTALLLAWLLIHVSGERRPSGDADL